jgi:tetratricopeptide (TPR) repeat protein
VRRPRSGSRQGPGLGGVPGRKRSQPELPESVEASIRAAADVQSERHRTLLVERVREAAAAYEAGRFRDALRLVSPLVNELPAVPEVRKVAGLAAYRLGRWRDAVRHLTAFFEMTDDTEELPMIMDSYRALGRRSAVTELWHEVRRRSPEADVLAEARIVAAGALADAGRLSDAIELLAGSGAAKVLRNPADRHLRQWYTLADLYERAGDIPRARELFQRVQRADPEAYDVEVRLEALSPGGAGQRPSRRRPAGPKTAGGRPSRSQGSASR